jgi:ABC-type phosphate transport system substrate-binding protein
VSSHKSEAGSLKSTESIMKSFGFLCFVQWLSSLSPGVYATIVVHGSGTSNPSRCIWHVMEQIQTQTKNPVRITYRSTSTGPGVTEFLGNVTFPYNDFASGDIPIPVENYRQLQDNDIEIIHLPVLMGAIGMFHSVPVKKGRNLNMTACTLA